MFTRMLRHIFYTLFLAYLFISAYGSFRLFVHGCPATPPFTHRDVQR